MNRNSKSRGEPSVVPVQAAWGTAAAVAAFFAAIENGHIIALGWTAACIAFPFVWNTQQQALRMSARILMAGLALLSLVAMASIVEDETWDVSDSFAFTVAALTVVAAGIIFVRIWRGDTRRTGPAVAAVDSDATVPSAEIVTPLPAPSGAWARWAIFPRPIPSRADTGIRLRRRTT